MVSWKSVLVMLGVLATLLEVGNGFFLPSSWTNGWSNQNPSTARKPDMSNKWVPTYNFREYPYYQQHYTYDAPQQVPVAVPYPVAISAPQPQPQMPPQPQQMSLPVSQPGPVVAASIHSSVQNMQLVPCLCSVPKEALEDDPNTHIVQTSQQISS